MNRYEADEMPQGKLWALEVAESGGRVEHAHSEKQHQQAITKGFQTVIDGDDGVPNLTAAKDLRRGGDKAPYLCQLFVPCIKGRLQIADDPVIQMISPHFSSEVRGAGSTACPFSVRPRQWR